MLLFMSYSYCSKSWLLFFSKIYISVLYHVNWDQKKKSPEIKVGFTNLDVFYLKKQDFFFFFNVVG